MSDTEVVDKVSELMETIDIVKRYRELARAMVDFAAILVIGAIASVLLVFLQGVYDVVLGFPVSGPGLPLGGIALPSNGLLSLLIVAIILGSVLGGALWVDQRVGRTKKGEWAETIKEEGPPGAMKVLSDLDWDSVFSTISSSKAAYLFYAIMKVAGYSMLVFFLLFIGGGILEVWSLLPSGPEFAAMLSVIIVLIFSKKSLQAGFDRLRSLDLLFWDLRWFYSEFKRAEFINKA